MKLYLRVFYLLTCLFLLASCSDQSSSADRKYTIGFSQCTSFDNWRQSMQEEMYRELSFHENMELVIKDANGSNELQITQIRELIDARVDLLIVSPNEARPMTQVVEEAYQRGIPVIMLDRKTSSDFYTAFIGANNYHIGKIAGRYAAGILNGKGKIIEIKGLQGSTPFIERHRGFAEEITKYPQISVAEIEGDWGDKKDAETAFVKLITSGEQFDLVYAHNDIMAFAAFNANKRINPDKPVKIIGVDGLAGPNGGIQYVSDGILHATILYPTGGDKAIQVASDILHNRPYDKENQLMTTVIDSSNVHVMQMQTNKILSHQNDISRMGDKIVQQKIVYRNQQYFLYIVALLFLISTVSFTYTLKLLRERREINKRLEKRNAEISRQKTEVLQMSEKANQAHEAKIKFFANISHEFKTPLTLILGPLDSLISDGLSALNYKKDLLMARKNVQRLIRLVNQLMDFQKIENSRLKVRASKTNLVTFLKEIMESFRSMAEKGKYTFKLYVPEPDIPVWIDLNMMDKVFFNLLSNAFKSTPDKGKISVTVALEKDKNTARVLVEDSGRGMTPEQIAHTFERYYSGEDSRADGTGLGLALSKELVELHKGNIAVSSEKGRGATFVVEVKLGNSHFNEDELIREDQQFISAYEVSDDFNFTEEENTGAEIPKDYTILIIEDNAEMLAFLTTKLQGTYNILKATDGEAGISIARECIPDLILCDMMLPKADGRKVLANMKADLRTSHIPFIIMTSNSSIEEKITGISEGADEYITKPFSYPFLCERIKTILVNRAKLREHYVHELPVEHAPKNEANLNKKFVNDFMVTVEENIANQQLDVNVLCELMGLSRVQLYRKVKAVLGYSVNDYITHVRLKKAKNLLRNTEQSIAEVGYSVGFSSPSYFSATFKSKIGYSPSEFRQTE